MCTKEYSQMHLYMCRIFNILHSSIIPGKEDSRWRCIKCGGSNEAEVWSMQSTSIRWGVSLKLHTKESTFMSVILCQRVYTHPQTNPPSLHLLRTALNLKQAHQRLDWCDSRMFCRKEKGNWSIQFLLLDEGTCAQRTVIRGSKTNFIWRWNCFKSRLLMRAKKSAFKYVRWYNLTQQELRYTSLLHLHLHIHSNYISELTDPEVLSGWKSKHDWFQVFLTLMDIVNDMTGRMR